MKRCMRHRARAAEQVMCGVGVGRCGCAVLAYGRRRAQVLAYVPSARRRRPGVRACAVVVEKARQNNGVLEIPA